MTVDVASGIALSVDGVGKTFAIKSGTVEALRDVTFSVRDGQFFSIVGPSGCGKSTLLSIVAGLEPQDAGEIAIASHPQGHPSRHSERFPARHSERSRGTSHADGYEVSRQARDDVRSRLGQVAYMPQKDLLLPWRTVLENAALGLELTGVPRRDAQDRARNLLGRFGLDGFADSYPATLSGGMRQRAAFLRTILTDRELLLLDEPFGALDALTRRSMQEWLLDVWSEMRRTVVLITHDVEEAIFLSDRIAVMSPRPGTIILERDVDLPRPRRADQVTNPEFIALKRDVLDALREGMEGAGDAPQ